MYTLGRGKAVPTAVVRPVGDLACSARTEAGQDAARETERLASHDISRSQQLSPEIKALRSAQT
eukprot:271421-Hanusia_phi.AAC.1